jgi:hypothetical protein
MGPIALRGTLNCALLKKATRRKIRAGDLDSRTGSAVLSLAIAFVDEPRLTMRLTTF